MGKNTFQAKQWLDKYDSDSALWETIESWYVDFNVIVQTQMMLNAQVTKIWQLSQKTPKYSANLFWPTVN